MPLVLIKADRRHGRLTDMYLHSVGLLMRETIANALDCDDLPGRLTMDDVEVDFQDRLATAIGGEQYHLQITVFANDYPSRKANLDARNEMITSRLRKHLSDDVRGYVWILLCPASFREF